MKEINITISNLHTDVWVQTNNDFATYQYFTPNGRIEEQIHNPVVAKMRELFL